MPQRDGIIRPLPATAFVTLSPIRKKFRLSLHGDGRELPRCASVETTYPRALSALRSFGL